MRIFGTQNRSRMPRYTRRIGSGRILGFLPRNRAQEAFAVSSPHFPRLFINKDQNPGHTIPLIPPQRRLTRCGSTILPLPRTLPGVEERPSLLETQIPR